MARPPEHGMHLHLLYNTWKAAKARVRGKYKDRGITMHPEWESDVISFIEYIEATLGPKPEGYSLDRKDNDKGYIPGNLRWASPVEQANNRRELRATNTSGAKGVARYGNYGKWQYMQMYNGVKHAKYGFSSFEEALSYKKEYESKHPKEASNASK